MINWLQQYWKDMDTDIDRMIYWLSRGDEKHFREQVEEFEADYEMWNSTIGELTQ